MVCFARLRVALTAAVKKNATRETLKRIDFVALHFDANEK